MSQAQTQYNDNKLQKVYKEFYDESGRVREMEYDIDPFLTMIGRGSMKDYEYIVSGKYVVVPLRNGGRLGSQSKTFSDAQADSQEDDAAPDYEAWHVKLDKETVVGSVDIQTMHAARDKRGSFVKPLLESTNRSIDTLKLKRSAQIYRDGTGQIGKVGAKSGATITLMNKWDAPLFYRGARIEIRDAAALGTLHQTARVIGVNRKSGVLTLNANVAAAVAATDVLYYKGDYGKLTVTGLSGWIRNSAQDGGSFMNIDRTVDDARLAGVKIPVTGGDLRDALIECQSEMAVQTGMHPKLDCFIMHPFMVRNLAKEMKTTLQLVRRTQSDSKIGDVSYNSYEVNFFNEKSVEVVQSLFVDANTIYAVDKSTWQRFQYTDEMITFDSGDGLPFLRKATDDGIEVRGYSFMGIACPTPGKNAIITVGSGSSAHVD